MTWENFKNNWVPVAIGLAVGIFFIWLDVSSQRAKDKEYQQRMEANGRWIDAKRKADLWTETPAQAAERKEAEHVLRLFLDEVLADHVAAAYQLTTPSFRERLTQQAFEELVRSNPVVKQADQCIYFGNASLSNGAITSVQLRKSPGDDKATTVVNVTAVKQDRWRVNDFTIKPRTKS